MQSEKAMESYRTRLNALMAQYMRHAMINGLDPRDINTEFGRLYSSLFMEHQRIREEGYAGSEELLERAKSYLENKC